MDHFFDLKLRADPEFSEVTLMSMLFGKLHRTLAAATHTGIGISFPAVKPQVPRIGDHLRLHGTATALDKLMATHWLAGLRDHSAIGDLQAVPPNTRHCKVMRRQCHSGAERLMRRHAKRHGGTQDELRLRFQNWTAQSLKLPFIYVSSSSTGQSFPLFVEHRSLASPVVVADGFNAYGLSAGGSVPWF